VERRASKTFDLKQIKTNSGAHYIDNCIEGADFMKMNAGDGLVMDTRLRFS